MGIDEDKRLYPKDANLRRQAIERLQAKTTEWYAPRTEEETQRLVHELEVHQVELEMQNEELRETRTALETTLAEYTDLYDFAPVGYLTLARKGNILAANLTCTGFLGIERSRLLNRSFHHFVAGEDIYSFKSFLESLFVNQFKKQCEVTLLNEDRQQFFVQMEAVAVESGEECRVAFSDNSERKRAQDELAEKIIQLETALATIKQLEGIIPICSYCGKIRDDKECWHQFEAYITEHTEALFSHVACPECFEKEMSAISKGKK